MSVNPDALVRAKVAVGMAVGIELAVFLSELETEKLRNARLYKVVGPYGLEPWTKGL